MQISLLKKVFATLAVAVFLFPVSSGWAVTKIDKHKVYKVTKNGTQYTCYTVRSAPKFVLKQSGAWTLGADAIIALKKSLAKKGILKKPSGKRKLKALKDRVAAGNTACLDDEDQDPSDPGNPSDPVSLTKLSRALTRSDIQYLLDKAALGVSSRETSLMDLGLSHGIDALVDELMKTHDEPTGLMDRVTDRLDTVLGISTTQTPAGQRSALLDLWINTNNPFQEKFAMFLLSVWTAAGDVIEDETFRYAFWDYYARLRTYSYSNDALPDLALAIARDPLMLIYLNNELNVKGNPNENFARELMELFTLGPSNLDGQPNYTETRTDGTGDIATAARMLTGWKVQKNYTINRLVSIYDGSRHQSGPHTMFPGTSYTFSGENDEDLVRGLFSHHPEVKRYYAKEILKVYLTPNPPRELIEKFGDVIETHGYRLREAMSILLRSEAFYDPTYRDTVPLNSFEFAAKTARILELFNGVNTSVEEQQIQKLGLLFNMAPSVFWYNPDVWSSSSVALEKANYVSEILSDSTAQSNAGWTPSKTLPQGAVSPTDLISFVQDRVGLSSLNDQQKQAALSYVTLQLQYNGVYTPFTYDNTNSNHQKSKGLGIYYLMFLTPEFNLL